MKARTDAMRHIRGVFGAHPPTGRPVGRPRKPRPANRYAEFLALRRGRPDLRGVRTTLGWTQVEIAEVLDVEQSTISKMELRADPRFSDMADYVDALGGRLEINAVFGTSVVPILTTARDPAPKPRGVARPGPPAPASGFYAGRRSASSASAARSRSTSPAVV